MEFPYWADKKFIPLQF